MTTEAWIAAAHARAHRGDRRLLRPALDALTAVLTLTYASDDGTEYEHTDHDPGEGEPECPACWADAIRDAITHALGFDEQRATPARRALTYTPEPS